MNTLGYDEITAEARKTIKIFMNFARMYENAGLKREQVLCAFGVFKFWSNLTALKGDQKEEDRIALRAILDEPVK